MMILCSWWSHPAYADPTTSAGVWVELSTAYGLQLGTTPYVPQEDGSSKNPLTNGYAVGATAGYEFIDSLSVVLNYEYTNASGRTGRVENALDRIEGSLSYHTLVAGLRSERAIGPGRLTGELAVGLLFPFETRLEFTYDPFLAVVGISGQGTRISEYNAGFGAHGSLGYQIDITDALYVGLTAKLKGFASNTDGKQARLDNFVDDFDALIPMAKTENVKFSSDAGSERPTTYSVQDLRLQLGIGLRF